MSELTLEELEKRVARRSNRYNERLRQNYRLARALGFSADEARILSFKDQATIHRLAKEREKRTHDRTES